MIVWGAGCHYNPSAMDRIIKALNTLLNYAEKKVGRPRVRSKPWKISLEVAQSCTLRCITCRHGVERFGGIMSAATFERAKPILSLARVVNETGYGEPLLDPQFIHKLRYAKELGAAVAAYTNAMGLTPSVGEQLVALQLDQLTFSIDGATKQTFESIRVGADYDRVLANIRQLHEIKARQGSRKPFLRANYVAMRRNIEELPLAVEVLAKIGIQEVIVSDLMPPSAELAKEHLSRWPELAAPAIAEARRVATRHGIAFVAPAEFPSPPSSQPQRIDGPHTPLDRDFYLRHPCYEPWQTVYIAHDGNVRPCCAMDRSFGNLANEDLTAIWNNAEYQLLRRSVNSREPAMPECRQCLLRRRVRVPLGELAAMGLRSVWCLGIAQTARKAARYLAEYA